MADKKVTTTSNSLLGDSSKQLMTSTLPKPNLSSNLLSKLGSTSTSLSLTSSLLLKPSSLISGLTLTSKIDCASFKPAIVSGLNNLTLQKRSNVKEVKKQTVKKASPKKAVEKVRSTVPIKKPSTTKRSCSKAKETQKRRKVQSAAIETEENEFDHLIYTPNYSIECDDKEYLEVDQETDFISPECGFVQKGSMSKADLANRKRGLINLVSGSLISQPNFKDRNDPTRFLLKDSVEAIVHDDPEFILKIALYSRKELNIRTTSNFLLALAATKNLCKPFLKKYFSACIALPSDWIEVAEIFQTIEEKNMKLGSLPAALRKVMISRFVDFDEYQLAKYNKESSGKKKKSAAKKLKLDQSKRRFMDSDSSDSDSDDDSHRKALNQVAGVSYDEKETEEELKNQKFTIKQLIRKLHITTPVEHVMSIIGKKYPSTSEEFYQARLPGVFEEEKGGKRMRLPIPETWETQVSLKGNKAKTWEDLIDHKKLPFMAMLRNLRNLIKAGISEKHHNNVIRRLCDRRQVVNSKQFPFRFFSAYVVLQELETALEKSQEEEKPTPSQSYKGRSETTKTPWWIIKKQKKDEQQKSKGLLYDVALIERYRKALDTSVKIATTYNVQPIKGRTVILCDFRRSMDVPCSSAKGLGKPRTIKEISALMSLMCQHACESCTFIVFDESDYKIVGLEDDLILKRLETLLSSDEMHEFCNDDGLPYKFLFEAFRDRVQIDNLLVFSQDCRPTDPFGEILNDFLVSYRHTVNPNLLFVAMVFSSPKPGFDTKLIPNHPNDIYISGYSDALLRFIAERGDSGLLQHVNKIDETFQLRPMPKSNTNIAKIIPKEIQGPMNGPSVKSPKPIWRSVRVFISSTFRDMHGERDLLINSIFPLLRDIARKHYVNVYEVDLRWGITEDESKNHQAVSLCLEEVARCQLFIGMLGERYGWIPETFVVPDTPDFDWVRQYPSGASVTELEMYAGALSKLEDVQESAFFFLRDNAFEKDLPALFKGDFLADNHESEMKMKKLKNKIRTSGLQVYDGYPCEWGGYAGDKPIVMGLGEFGARMLNTLVNAVKKLCPDEDPALTEEIHINNQHWAVIQKHLEGFNGSTDLVSSITKKILGSKSCVVGINGKAGSGKTCVMAAVINRIYQVLKTDINLFVNIAGAATGSNNLAATLRRLAQMINANYELGHTLPDNYMSLVAKFEELLTEAGTVSPVPVVVFLDGIDLMDKNNFPSSLEWLPTNIPNNVVFVLSAMEGGTTAKSLTRIGAMEFSVKALNWQEKADVVRQTLAKHRKALNESGFGNEMKLLMLKKDAHNPLYLKLACEELRMFGVFEKVGEKLRSLPHTTTQMLQEILSRLETEYGKHKVGLSLSLIACSREGLHSEELRTLLSWNNRMELFDESNDITDILELCQNLESDISLLTFSYLAHSIMSFLNPSSKWSPLLSFANAEIETAVRIRYMKAKLSWEIQMHRLLAGYFWRQACPTDLYAWESQNTRAYVQLPYHLACAGNFASLESVLCSLKFIQAKCSLGLATSLLDDFELKESCIKQRDAAKFLALSKVQEYKSFISRNVNIFNKFPSLVLQQALNEPTSTLPYLEAVQIRDEMKIPLSHMTSLKPSETEDQCYRTVSADATCMKVSPNGNLIATGSPDTIVRLYNKDTGKELSSFMGHSDVITDLCFVSNKILCSASADTTLSVWDTEYGHRIHLLKGHGRRVDACGVDSEGKIIASGGWDGLVILWDLSNGKNIHTFEIGSPVNSVDFHPEVQLLVVGSWDSKIRIFNTLYHKRVAVLNGHIESVRDVVFSNDGLHLASADMDGDVKIWDSKKGVVVGSVKGHSEPITKLQFTPTGKELVTASNDHLIKVWSSNLGFPLHCLKQKKFGGATAVVLSRNRQTVAIGYHSGHVVLHSIDTGEKQFLHKVCDSPVRDLEFYLEKKYDETYLLVACGNHVYILNTTEKKCFAKLTGHSKPVLCVTSRDKIILSGGEDTAVCFYMKVSSKANDPFNNEVSFDYRFDGHTAPVSSVSHTCNKDDDEDITFISSSREANLCIYKYDRRIANKIEMKKSIPFCHADWINSVDLDSDTNMAATGSNDFKIKLWDQSDFTQKHELSGHTGSVNTVAFKSGYVVSGSSDKTLKIWSHQGVEVTTLRGHSERVNACFLSFGDNDKTILNETMVASAGDDGDVWLWKPFLANQLASLSGHADRVLSVSADKTGLVTSCSLDGSVKVWKPQLKKDVDNSVHNAPVTFIARSSVINLVISGSRDGVIKVWKYETTTGTLVLQLSFQAHSKSVNCGSFEMDSSDSFITGGDDNFITQWELSEDQKGMHVRKAGYIHHDQPITSVQCETKPGQTIFSTLFGRLQLCNVQKRNITTFFKMNKEKETIKSWATSFAYNEKNPLELKCTTTSNEILVFSIGSKGDSIQFEKSVKVDKNNIDVLKTPNWVCCITETMGVSLAGDSSGHLYLQDDKNNDTYIKIHDSDVTAIETVGQTVFTASTDSTLKVWTLSKEHNSLSVNQIGQFFCLAPLTSLKVATHQQKGPLYSAFLAVGDKLGNVQLLKWQSSSM